MLVKTYNWLKLGLIYSFLWPDYAQALIFFFVLGYYLLHWSVMLLVTGENVGDKWTFTRQESAGNLKCFSMPEFTFSLYIYWVKGKLFLGADKESKLS